jgi:hypothetical protein
LPLLSVYLCVLLVVAWTLSASVFYAMFVFTNIPIVLGLWTWRYWTTLEPIEKKKKR